MPQTTNIAKRSSGKSGATCRESGPYYSGRNAKVIVFMVAGRPFPVDADGSATIWTLVQEGQKVSNGQLLDDSLADTQ